MKFSVAQLLEVCSEDKLVAPKAIEKKLGIESHEDVCHLQTALDALEKSGILEKDKGKYRRSLEDGLVEGRLRCSSKGYCFAVQEIEGAEVIYIRENKLSSAWNGDRVLVKVTKDGMRRRNPEGEVRLVVERSNNRILATVKPTSNGYRGVPLDNRLNFEIDLVPGEEIETLEGSTDRLVHLDVVRYALGNLPALGRVTRILGNDEDSTQDQELVRCKHNLPDRFGTELLDLAKTLGSEMPTLTNRVDLRSLLVVQLGDALISIEQHSDYWEIGVHIPDLATYITEESELDAIARDRGRSYFLGEQVIPLWPPLEFLQQPDRLCVSVTMHLTAEGSLQFFELQPTIVNVGAILSYSEAQAIFDSNQVSHSHYQVLERIFNSQQAVDAYISTVVLNLPVLWGSEGDDGILGLTISPHNLPIYGLVARLLIMANRTIALHLKALGLPGIFYSQSTPDGDRMTDWFNLLEELGVAAPESEFSPTSVRSLLDSLDKIDTPARQDIVKQLFLVFLRQGEYGLQPLPHFGMMLAGRSADAPYCHGVFPQHRYGDLLIQRLILLLFTEGRDRRSSRSKGGVDLRTSKCHGQISWSVLPPEIERQCRNNAETVLPSLNQSINLGFRAATDLEGLRKVSLVRLHVGKNFYGMISAVQKYRFFVNLEDSLAEGLVHVSSLKDDWYEFQQNPHNKRGRALTGKRSGKQYGLGDRIEVQVRGVDYYRQQIDLGIVRNGIVSDSSDSDEEDYDPEEILDE